MADTRLYTLPFEAPLRELKQRIDEMMQTAANNPSMESLLRSMQEQYAKIEHELYTNLSAWNTIELARHPHRPQMRDYIKLSFDTFEELHGDRAFRDDLAIVTGLARIGPYRILLVGQHKGRNVEERHLCHAGCPHPEGYRKAMLKMRLAERFHLPIVSLIDTKGAYPGIGSEERGQGLALAENIRDMARLRTPIVCVIIGEGGSGGALAIGVGDRILMLRHAYYSVISPEGCASILWRDGEKKQQAAEVLKLTSRDLKEHGFIDAIVEEPLGGAHRDPPLMGKLLREAILAALDEICGIPIEDLVEARYRKFRSFGVFLTGQTLPSPPSAEEENGSAVPSSEDRTGSGDRNEPILPPASEGAPSSSSE